jgi:hypothetical protein
MKSEGDARIDKRNEDKKKMNGVLQGRMQIKNYQNISLYD